MLKIREMFNQIHKRYDMLNHLMSGGRDIAWRKACCKKLPQKKEAVVLDLCGGTGDFMISYLKRTENCKLPIIGDFAEKMLGVAAKKSPDLIPVQMDATQIPLANGSVDIILNGFGMRNIQHLDLALSEGFRVLKKGGYFATLDFFKPEKKVAKLFYQRIAPLAIPFVGMIFSKRNAYRYLVISILNFLNPVDYVAKARNAGFTLRSISSLDGGLAHIVICEKK
ncbi:MAG: ubiquinone/menaquinone biosynthesis methyltransferase [Fibromonadaceae bacterium]|jgi:demethylmenaquinone methyltransferase/2-methoxy-6-polyprenyl-1,4-benzoquinol methylase|nr:ubiquinone/menaquinone biosynthesis methyltransferase [Fibromonadaceae bacterium]